MPVDINLELTPRQAADDVLLRKALDDRLGSKPNQISDYKILRKSIDARRGKIKFNLGIRVYLKGENKEDIAPEFKRLNVAKSEPVVIVGAGPAGLFAALRLLELGYKPIVVERGKTISERKRDIALLNREQILNPESNYAFGEGGAGTFSDGKLYTRSKKRGDTKRILFTLTTHGADPAILYEAHPHIGTNKLPGVITNIRKTIIEHGGEFLFGSRASRITIKNGRACGVELEGGTRVDGKAVILAAGHSARDIYDMLLAQGIEIESKPFAMGVRVEHPQLLIDSIQYHGIKRDEFIPAATYNLVHQVKGRGVYSFCMCPGGFIVPAATSIGEVVVNGMSPSARNSKWANSGIVVEVRAEDLASFDNYKQLAGLYYQRHLEQLAFQHGSQGVKAPAQRLVDFANGTHSASLPTCSYHPGVTSSGLHEWLPKEISDRLREGFREFDKKMRGFLTNEAIILGVESRTSSPVRILRNPETLQHIAVQGLFPSGEGSGYAGGIVSSAIDGERSAEGVARFLK